MRAHSLLQTLIYTTLTSIVSARFRLGRKSTGSAGLHGADLGPHGFKPGRDRDQERVGAEYRHVRAL